MEYKLKRTVNPKLQNIVRRTAVRKPIDLLLVNICCIGAIGFYQNLVQPDTITFMTSLYEINQIIKDKETLAYNQLNRKGNDFIDKELVEWKLPCNYQKFKDVFFKAVSDILPPHRLYDYKIKIDLGKEDTFSYSPLRQQFTAKLQAIKQYLLNNLDKGFIKPNN